jgi:hypothetical protein
VFIEIELFEFPGQTPLDFCLWGWVKGEVYKRSVHKRDELLARILDDDAQIKKREGQLRQTTRDLRTGAAKCIEVDGGILEYLLRTATDFSFLCNNFFI